MVGTNEIPNGSHPKFYGLFRGYYFSQKTHPLERKIQHYDKTWQATGGSRRPS